MPNLGMCSVSQTALSRRLLIYQILWNAWPDPGTYSDLTYVQYTTTCDVAHSLAWAAAGGDGSVSPVTLVWQDIMSIWKRGKEQVDSETS